MLEILLTSNFTNSPVNFTSCRLPNGTTNNWLKFDNDNYVYRQAFNKSNYNLNYNT